MRRTKVADDTFTYGGYFDVPSQCRVRIYTGEGRPPAIVATELHNNTGTSITNCAEWLYPAIIARYLPGWLDQADGLVLIEHYPPEPGAQGHRSRDTFALVGFAHWKPIIKQEGNRKFVAFGEPRWELLDEQFFTGMVDESKEAAGGT